MIAVAAIAIITESILEWIVDLKLEHLGSGIMLILIAGILNAGLGYYLVHAGRRIVSSQVDVLPPNG
jgi:divalent metal cation (Fe/Co/Zn/Cd) transporter